MSAQAGLRREKILDRVAQRLFGGRLFKLEGPKELASEIASRVGRALPPRLPGIPVLAVPFHGKLHVRRRVRIAENRADALQLLAESLLK